MLKLKNVSKTYDEKRQRVDVIKNLSFTVKEGQFIALVGPSGCGKTTLLRLIAGLLPASDGEILLDEQNIVTAGKDRGLVFQQFTLFPWLTVRQNISFGLDLQKLTADTKTKITNRYLDIINLNDFADFYPKDLSGGMQQRVAIARTLATNPRVLLMDEPFGALDAQTRLTMQEFLTKLWDAERHTIVFVTHDVAEAAFLADTVVVLSRRPMETKKVFPVPFVRPRTHQLKQTKEFFEFENTIAQELER